MIAETVADLTPEFLSAALSAAGTPTTVTAVDALRVGTGQVGTTYRLTLDYADGSSGPDRLVAKLAAADPAMRPHVAHGYRKEVTFYRSLADTVAVAAPKCYFTALSDDATTFTLLLEDLSPAVPGVQAKGCSPEAASAALRNAARLHGPRWNDESLRDLLGFYGAGVDMAALQADATDRFIAYFDDGLEDGVAKTMRAAAAVTTAWLRTRDRPFAPVHGDYRLDNLMFYPDGSVVALDWQTIALAPAARDVAYFLGTSLHTEARREHERDLVGAYHDELVSHGVVDYPVDRCFEDYRLGLLQAPMITTIGCMYSPGQRSADIDQMFLAMANRGATAISDLHSLELVT